MLEIPTTFKPQLHSSNNNRVSCQMLYQECQIAAHVCSCRWLLFKLVHVLHTESLSPSVNLSNVHSVLVALLCHHVLTCCLWLPTSRSWVPQAWEVVRAKRHGRGRGEGWGGLAAVTSQQAQNLAENEVPFWKVHVCPSLTRQGLVYSVALVDADSSSNRWG